MNRCEGTGKGGAYCFFSSSTAVLPAFRDCCPEVTSGAVKAGFAVAGAASAASGTDVVIADAAGVDREADVAGAVAVGAGMIADDEVFDAGGVAGAGVAGGGHVDAVASVVAGKCFSMNWYGCANRKPCCSTKLF